MSDNNAHTGPRNRVALWRLVRLFFVDPVVDDARQVKWWQYVNRHGVCMTKVVDLRSPGWTVESNRIGEGAVTDADITELVAFLRSPPNNELRNGDGIAASQPDSTP